MCILVHASWVKVIDVLGSKEIPDDSYEALGDVVHTVVQERCKLDIRSNIIFEHMNALRDLDLGARIVPIFRGTDVATIVVMATKVP